MSSISHLGQDFIKLTLDDVIMMMIDGDQGMTGATLHTMLIYISLDLWKKTKRIALIHLLKRYVLVALYMMMIS